MLRRGILDEMMVQVDPSMYHKYETYSPNGQAMLYFSLSKALYSMLRAALLFYKRLRSDLDNMGFEVNPYNPCVTNKMVNGHHMTIFWHVDDLKMSHKDEDTVTALALKLASMYGPKTTISCGNVHENIGMYIDWLTKPGVMIVSMVKYLQKIIEEFPELIKSDSPSSAGDQFFDVREEADCKMLPEEQSRQFHCTVAQLLFLCNQDRPYIEPFLSFLTTRVKEPDKDDWGKLKHGLK